MTERKLSRFRNKGKNNLVRLKTYRSFPNKGNGQKVDQENDHPGDKLKLNGLLTNEDSAGGHQDAQE